MKKVYSCEQNSQESKSSPELFVSRNLQECKPSTELAKSLFLYMACPEIGEKKCQWLVLYALNEHSGERISFPVSLKP